ncbi:transposase (plasmid) [Streptomyces sp. NBC_01340]|uniref:transposase n=1 Tax=unclassified Streptomyces TaxID=2593676 RepID=UPI002259D9E8|nr:MULTISPECIES: transposase [unclassified Streptomyces]MCX4597739.1 transposase [Streptomyces sp. NBC_01549]WSI45910.1 transposase [Streptomyces sp. NBC_01340]
MSPRPGQQRPTGPLSDLLAHRGPTDRGAVTKGQCQPCSVRAQCTTSRDGARNAGFPPRELRDLQVRFRAEQQTPDGQARYAIRSGAEGTVNELADEQGMRRCRYR